MDKSTGLPGVGAPADSTSAPNGESTGAKVLREAAEKRLSEEAQALADAMGLLEGEAHAEEAERAEAARLLAEQMALLEDEARDEDHLRSERLKNAQTSSEKAADRAVTLTVWALPEIGEFPATIVLENHTRNRISVAGARVFLAPYDKVEVEVTEDQFAKLAKALTSSARAHKWDNLKGLQVKYDRRN
ncbi:hypothetical protein WG29040_23455 [Pseudomonas sp. PAMC 29040]|nr:hypothetical protein WG29040_23455 [Pseudomonas sp. PAMC 29040]